MTRTKGGSSSRPFKRSFKVETIIRLRENIRELEEQVELLQQQVKNLTIPVVSKSVSNERKTLLIAFCTWMKKTGRIPPIHTDDSEAEFVDAYLKSNL